MLPRLSLAFTTPGWRLLHAGQAGLWLVILASLGFSLWAWRDSRTLQTDAARYEQAAERIRADTQQFVAQAKQAGLNLSDERTKTIPREVAFANQLLEKLAFSWTRFLSDLENTVPPRTSIASVSLNFNGSTITLTGTALSLKDVTTFVDRLENHPSFEKVALSQYRTTELRPKERHGQRGHEPEGMPVVEFTMTVLHRPRL